MSEAPNDDTALLTARQCELHSVPSGSQWFFRQAPVLASLPEKSGFMTGWDTRSGSKLFAAYPSAPDFYTNLLLNPPEKRWAYEIIPESAPCKAYMDIEWLSPIDQGFDKHSRILLMIADTRDRFKQEHSREPEIYVCCGSRPGSGKDSAFYKNSYHVVIANLVFENNWDGQMRAFFMRDPSDTLWYHPDPDPNPNRHGKPKSLVDLLVYTKNRQFRLPLASKLGSKVPLTRISGDPFDDEDDFTSNAYSEQDIDNLLPMVLTHPPEEPDFIFVPATAILEEEQPKTQKRQEKSGGGHKRKPSNSLPTCNDRRPIPISNLQIEQALSQCGDCVSSISKVSFISDTEDSACWQIQCDQKQQTRTCLMDPATRTHQSNNCLLFLKPTDITTMELKYHCTASECCRKPNLILGQFKLVDWNSGWQFQKPAQAEDQQMEEDTGTAHESDPVDEAEADPAELEEDPDWAGIDPNDPALNSYIQVKARFEKKCFKIKTPSQYVRITKKKELVSMQETLFAKHYRHLKYWGVNEKGEQVKLPFIHAWLNDDKIRKYERVVMDPIKNDPDDYNMWPGFLSEKLPPVPDEEVATLVAPVVKHIHEVITCENQEHTEWVLDYLANIVIRPWQKTQVALSIVGLEGCGKGILLDWLRDQILGEDITHQTDNITSDLFDRFSDSFVNKVMIQGDEVKNVFEHVERLKDFISGKYRKFEQKYVQKKDKVPNMCHLILTSNNENTIRVPPDDRRYCLFRCNNRYKGNDAYFNQLGAQLANPRVQRAFFQFLRARDLTKYEPHFQNSRPITDYYKENQAICICPLYRFTSAVVNSEHEETVRATHFYQMYCQFCDTNGFKFKKDKAHFVKDVMHIEGITKYRTNACILYKFDLKIMKEYLVKHKQFDEDADLPS